MLDVYRQKCITQSAEIERLKEAMEDALIGSVRAPPPTATGTRNASVGPAPSTVSSDPKLTVNTSKEYLDEIADELESVLVKNELLEREVAKLQQRLDMEEAWRAAAMEFMELDTRIHAIAGINMTPDFSIPSMRTSISAVKKKKSKGGLPPTAGYHEALRDALAKTKRLEKSLRAAL